MDSVKRYYCSVAVLAFVAALGCGSGGATYQPVESDLYTLKMFYSKYGSDHSGQHVASDEELKNYIASSPPELLDKFNVGDVDQLFISARDEKPYIILYGDASRQTYGGVIAYEQEGQDGKRWVVDRLGVIELVEQADFERMMGGS